MTDFANVKIGDTPTIGAGFWAEEWNESSRERRMREPQDLSPRLPPALSDLTNGLRYALGNCINFSGYQKLPSAQELGLEKVESMNTIRAVAMSGLSHPYP